MKQPTGSFLVKLALTFISFPPFSRMWGWLTARQTPRFLVKKVIALFQHHYGIEMDDFVGTPEDYPSLVAFFTRPLDPEKRPLHTKKGTLLSPADGLVSVIDTATRDSTVQAKGINYRLSDLIRQPAASCEHEKYRVITIYLSPADYHRYHAPIDCTVRSFCHAKGPLYPVNALSVHNIPDLFIKNERVIIKCSTDGTEWFYVAVGATFVGSIVMNLKKFKDKSYSFDRWEPCDQQWKQCEETGMFRMGSTIILVIPEHKAGTMSVREGDRVVVGQPLCEWLNEG